jgi:hypothetical protein
VQFCSNSTELEDFFQSVLDDIQHILVILSIVILVAAILSMVPFGVMEWWKWKKAKIHANMVQEAVRSMDKPDYLEVEQILAAPFMYKLSRFISNRFSSPKKKVLVRWFIAYITHQPALLLLAIAIAALLSCLLQIILLNEIRVAVPILETDISDLEGVVTSKITDATNLWVNGTNTHLELIENDINQSLFGWAGSATETLNTTLGTCIIFLSNFTDI